MDHLYYLCLVFDMLSRLFIAALWSPDGKRLKRDVATGLIRRPCDALFLYRS